MGITDLIGGYFTPPASGFPQQPAAGNDPGNASAPPGMQILDWRDLVATSAPAGADGLCTVTFLPVDPGNLWLVDHETVSCTSSTRTACFVYLGPDIRPQNLRDFTGSGNLDIADNSSPLQIPGSRSLTYQWVGASLGAIATAAIQYRLLG
jgi:hypothetical protein